MSGISGVCHLDGRPVGEAVLARMSERMAHRGPDGLDHWHRGSIGLSALHLRTTPEAAGETQPLPFGDGAALVGDLRLDNRPTLLRALGLVDRPAESVSDAELVVSAYLRWGEACVDHLLGAFAFVLWDPSRHLLFGARDHLGVKPFYYAFRRSDFFAFASEIKALLTVESVDASPNPQALANQLLIPVEDDPHSTFYKGVSVLPPAHWVAVRQGVVETARYWTPDPRRQHGSATDEEFALEYRRLFSQAVERRLRSSGPVGSMLSGGLDSSSIVAVAATALTREGRPKLHTLSATYGDSTSDERPYIDAMIDAFEVDPQFMAADETSPLVDTDRIAALLDRPNPAGNLHLSWTMFALARDAGCRVVFEGFDGDSTVSHGIHFLTELAYRGRFLELRRQLEAWGTRHGEPWRQTFRTMVRSRFLQRRLEELGIYRAYRRIRRIPDWAPPPIGDDPEWRSVLAPDFATTVTALGREPEVFFASERAFHHALITKPLMSRTMGLLDLTAAARGVEARFPFMDKDLIEFCLALPPRQKIRDGWTRWVARQGLRGVLPDVICDRPGKSSLTHGFFYALGRFETERLKRFVEAPPHGIDRYVRAEFLRETFEKFAAGRAEEREMAIFFRAFSVSQWLGAAG